MAVPQGPCASMDEGFGSVWTATCVERGIARIDPESGTVTSWTAVDVPGDGESSIVPSRAVSGRSPSEECIRCVLVRIDPRRIEMIDSFDITEGGTAVRAGEVALDHVCRRQRSARRRPQDGEIVAEIDVGQPEFLRCRRGRRLRHERAGGVLHPTFIEADTALQRSRSMSWGSGGRFDRR